MSVTVDAVIAKYIETRDIIEAKKRAFDTEVAALKSVQEKRAAWLMSIMDNIGATSMKATVGTCFVEYKDSASVADAGLFLDWVRADWEERKNFLENRVSKTAVKQRVEDGETLPPGISYTKIKDVKVRRA